MMSSYIQSLKNADVQTPAPMSRDQTVHGDQTIHRTFGYSPEDNGKNSKNPRVLAKQMDKLKNFGTIQISDNTEDDRSNVKKRTSTNTNFVRGNTSSKRQNTDKGKLPFVYSHTPNDDGDDVDTNVVQFNSDYRRGFNAKVIQFVNVISHIIGFCLNIVLCETKIASRLS
jgi:hypothetical protein